MCTSHTFTADNTDSTFTTTATTTAIDPWHISRTGRDIAILSQNSLLWHSGRLW